MTARLRSTDFGRKRSAALSLNGLYGSNEMEETVLGSRFSRRRARTAVRSGSAMTIACRSWSTATTIRFSVSRASARGGQFDVVSPERELMPVKIWELDGEQLSSHVVTEWERVWTSEEFRAEADDLDAELDHILDTSVDQVAKSSTTDVPVEFARAWAVGACLNESDVLRSPAMERELPQLLWRALARKIRIGARSDGTREQRWHHLRPQRVEEPRREGRKLDPFEMCRWLAQQTFQDSCDTFWRLGAQCLANARTPYTCTRTGNEDCPPVVASFAAYGAADSLLRH
jgi:hypothetical protein